MSNVFCVICKDLQENDGSCSCQPAKSTCDVCKSIEDIDYCECKIDGFLIGLELPEADEEESCDCPACMEVHYGCDCGCFDSYYYENPGLWEEELNNCKNIV